MTKEQIIEFLEKESHKFEIEYITYCNDKNEAMDSHQLDRANKLRDFEMDSYKIHIELDYILSRIKENKNE